MSWGGARTAACSPPHPAPGQGRTEREGGRGRGAGCLPEMEAGVPWRTKSAADRWPGTPTPRGG